MSDKKLFWRMNYTHGIVLENYGFLDNFSINDVITADVSQDKLKAEITYVNGNKYARYEVKQTFITPIKSGTFTIPAYNFQVSKHRGLFKSYKPVYLQTESKELIVKPLPIENQPADFSGIVGDLNLEAKYSKQEVDFGRFSSSSGYSFRQLQS